VARADNGEVGVVARGGAKSPNEQVQTKRLREPLARLRRNADRSLSDTSRSVG
jgi:hypothetical protein